jgi:hypothetical protein
VKAFAIIGVITTHSVLLSFILAADMQFYAWQAIAIIHNMYWVALVLIILSKRDKPKASLFV